MFVKCLRLELTANRLLLFGGLLAFVNSATHDELPQCGLSGIFKTRQSVIESPNYPNNYPTKTCWDYVIRSPYRCPTKFHIQFLDFHLESSDNCSHDYLAIGLENDGDDMDLLCGQVIGIKKYHTPDGILRLRFLSDDSPWTTARGFKLLITRLACEREDYMQKTSHWQDEDTEEVLAPTLEFQPPKNMLPELFRNWTGSDQHLPYPTAPLFGWNVPGHLPVPPPPSAGPGGLYIAEQNLQSASQSLGNNKPCLEDKGLVSYYPPYVHYPSLGYRSNQEKNPSNPDQYVGAYQETKQTIKSPTNNAQSRQKFRADPPFADGRQFGSQFGAQVGMQYAPSFAVFYPTAAQSNIPQISVGTFEGPQFEGSQLSVVQPGGTPSFNTPTIASPTLVPIHRCCTAAFNQKRFYLSSPGFPRTAFTSLLPAQQRDCLIELNKNADNICQLHIKFKFFNFGQPLRGTGDLEHGNIGGTIRTSRDVCTDDFIELNGERFCGCRTGYIYTSPWSLGSPQQLRIRTGYSGIPSIGFLLDINQEECQGANFGQSQHPPGSLFIQPTVEGQFNLNTRGEQSSLAISNSTVPSIHSQQQLPHYQQPSYFTQPLFPHNDVVQYQVPYRTVQSPNLSPYLPPYPTQMWPSLIQPQHHSFLSNPYVPNGPPVPLYRNAKILSSTPAASSVHQPVTVVGTNSTRKEYYYFDGDETFGNSRANVEPNDIDRNGIAPADESVRETSIASATTTNRHSCTFTTMDALRLKADLLWISKPTCYAPLQTWFSSSSG